jgi:hypothetical protein
VLISGNKSGVKVESFDSKLYLSGRFKIMSELTFEQMLEDSLKTIHTGEVVNGTVIAVKPEELVLNIILG